MPTLDPAGAPPLAHRFRSAAGEHLLVVPFTRLFDLPDAEVAALDADPQAMHALAASLGAIATGEVALDEIAEPEPQSISLNVSSSCNLGCSYCYADRGGFAGAQDTPMAWDVARVAIDRVLLVAQPDRPVTIGFLGGEPFVNRNLIHRAVAHAAAEGCRRGLDVRFSVTTNGTLLQANDLALLRAHPFAVTVSLDGAAEVNDAQRPTRHGA